MVLGSLKKKSIPTLFSILRKMSLLNSYLSIEIESHVAYNTIQSIEKDLTRRMDKWLTDHISFEPMFFKNETVQIDEAKIKWEANGPDFAFENDGEHKEKGEWILGLINSMGNKVYFQCVKDRSAQSLLDPIEDQVERDATIYTDALSTYQGLHKKYTHKIINKQLNGFCSCRDFPGTHINVNQIECQWKHLRAFLRERHIIHPSSVPSALIQYMFKFYHGCIFDSQPWIKNA